MNEVLTKKLWNNYPEILDVGKEGYGIGFECSDGWYELIDSLCDEITQYCKRFNKELPKASQIKEKFGSLRFYVWSAPVEIHDIISKYELRSEYICEICGEAGKIRNIRGWYSCLCDKHLADRYERLEKFWKKENEQWI
jgi:hypothetical protein